MANRYCLIKTEEAAPTSEWPARKQYTAWCGHKQHTEVCLTRSPENRQLCPKCAQKYAAAQLKTTDLPYKLGDRLDLTNDPRRYAYKSIYPILDTRRAADDQVIGFVTIQNGWGKQWRVHPLHVPVEYRHARDDVPLDEPRMFGNPVRYRRDPGDRAEWDAVFKSKEGCLLKVPTLVEQNKLPSYQTVVATAKAQVADMRTRRWERERAEEAAKARAKETADARAERLRIVTERFRAMLSGNLPLLEDDQQALRWAAELLGISLGEEQTIEA